MDGDSSLKTGSEVEPAKEKQWQLEKRIKEQHMKRKSRYLPFSIQPMPYERQRLAEPMTDEDRFLRKQWLKDQILSHKEPRHVEGLKPKNIFKRIYGYPADLMYKAFIPVVGEIPAAVGRIIIPRILLTFGVLYYWYYCIKYSPNDWTRGKGWYLYSTRPKAYTIDEYPAEKDHDDFFDKGFKRRTCLKDGKTSFVSE
ncbi:hypothetical protein CHS0354_029550 [Potamilus streckersoni]|uniref:NADH dehydrogenase [ubiquinone] 1 beta subcomplex subunit 6 n=1 Tax=Potamilus streckersoni TaxID=2493646 RepID=A0AAE0SZA0_9BIVA|nr:hypothetical protein CHS0354_029550 [Potamilus streckersoni]